MINTGVKTTVHASSGALILRYPLLCVISQLQSLLPDKKGLMFMETSALDSTNVEAAFNEVLKGMLCTCTNL